MGVRLEQRALYDYGGRYLADDLYGPDKKGTAVQIWRAEIADLGWVECCPPDVHVVPIPPVGDQFEIVVYGPIRPKDE